MTLCLAAFSSDNIITVSDRLITVGDEYQYEGTVSKTHILPVATTTLMIAGDLSLQGEILDALKRLIMPTSREINRLTIKEVADAYQQALSGIHDGRRANMILQKYGLTQDSFISRQQELSDGFVQRVCDELDEIPRPDVEVVIAGYDEQGIPQLYVNRKGKPSYENYFGFAAVGTGSREAEAKLVDLQFSPNLALSDALLACFFAKKRAEVVPGVGEATHISYVSNGTYHAILPDEFAIMERLYNKMEMERTRIYGELRDELRKYLYESQELKRKDVQHP